MESEKGNGEMNEKIAAILDGYRDEMVEKLQEIIRIESVAEMEGEVGKCDAPFGEGPKKALEYMMELGKEKGFDVTNYDNVACQLDFGERKDDAVGTVGHVDVVPAGGEWKYPPYGGELHDGVIYGRGAIDDKGPTIATFYAALAIRESGLPLSRNIVQIVGSYEEGGYFPCLHRYLEKAERIQSCGIVPDSFFPICFSEKHFVNTRFTMMTAGMDAGTQDEKTGLILKSIRGGDAINIVPSWAEAIFTDSQGNEVKRVKTTGVPAHASTPEQGKNAIAMLLEELAQMDYEPRDICGGIKLLPPLVCRDVTGEGLGIREKDETGESTNNMGLISYENGKLDIDFNARLPFSLETEDMVGRVKKALAGTGFSVEMTLNIEGFRVDPQQEPAKTLIEVYREATGDNESKPFANGSGSYARVLKDFVPYGMALQNEPLLFHVENESISVDRLMSVAKIYAEALYRLAR